MNWRDITSPSAGGAELYTHQVATKLARSGHEVTLFTSRHHGSLASETKDGIEIVRRGNRLSVYLEAPRFFRSRRNSTNRFDIIIDALNTIPFLSPLYVKRAGIVLLVYQLTGEIFLKEFPHPLGHLFYALERRRYLPWCMSRADKVVTLTHSNRAELFQVCPQLAPEDVWVVPPGADHGKFVPGTKSDYPLVLFLNRLVKYKQPENLVEVMKKIQSRVPNVKLVIAGTNVSGAYAAKLLLLVRRLGLEQCVVFDPSEPFSGTKLSLLQRAWVHALPSLKEGFGLSILEAAACETPTVGYDVTGVKDAVVQGKTGLLARPGNTGDFANHMLDLLTNEDKRRLFGKQAAKHAAAYTWSRTAEKFSDIFKGPFRRPLKAYR